MVPAVTNGTTVSAAAIAPGVATKAYLRVAPTRVEKGKRIVLTARTVPAIRGFRVQVQRSWNAGRTWTVERTIVTNRKGLASVVVSTSRVGISKVRLRVLPSGRFRATLSGAVAVNVEAWKPAPSAPVVPTRPALVPNHKRVPPKLFGMNPLSGFPDVPVNSIRLWDTGTSWSKVETSRGVYDWTRMDALIDAAQSNGSSVMVVLGGTPPWAGTGTPPTAPVEHAGPGTASVPANFDDFSHYVRAVATRYVTRNPGVVDAYQVWNEANIPNYWRGTPAQMADLTARAYNVVKSIDSSAAVVAASSGTRWVQGYAKFFPGYLSALRARNWPVDAFSVHTYPYSDGETYERNRLLGMVQMSLRDAGDPAIPIWETEINYGLTGGTPVSYDAETQRALVARTYLDSLRFGLQRVYWYGWTPSRDLLGIPMGQGSAGAVAYASVYRWIVGQRFEECVQRGALVSCRFTKDGATSEVAWADTGSASFRVPASARSMTLLEGTNRPVTPGQQITVGQEPIRFGR